MAEMAELSELYEESNDLQMDVQMEVGRGGRGPAVRGAAQAEEEGPMEEEAAPSARAPRGLADPDFEAEDFDDWEDDYSYPEEERRGGASYRVSAALEEANKMFRRTSGEAALDGGFQMRCEKTPFDQLAFIEELFSLMVVNRLTEELGCDEIIDRE
ncbi:EP300-interacting inhibitor of differentiation 1 [Nannospalax galili]|uniref:EP300-interacting inhibitor of differentiation 1 n=1 Tax=Nannospalax galili TaxID=1026970 RepID=UPI0004ED4D41|nr:EP300-interacting inhibitor of differentiation 1 [Nannospalax galili]